MNANANGNPDYSDSRSPLATADDRLEVRAPVKAGMRQVIATIVKADNVVLEGLGPNSIPVWSREHTTRTENPLVISSRYGGKSGGAYHRTRPDGGGFRLRAKAA